MIRSLRHSPWFVTILFFGLMAAGSAYAALPQTVNPAAPADTDPVSQGASQIRTLKQGIVDIFGVPSNAAVSGAALAIATDGTVNSANLGSTTTMVKFTGLLQSSAGAISVFSGQPSASNQKLISDSTTRGIWVANQPSIQVFTSTSTWSRPSNVVFIEVVVTGAGGGGGASDGASNGSGGGGGGGGTCIKVVDVTGTASVAVTVGAGGAAGSSGSGAAGGTSSFGAHCSATGGAGGARGAGGLGGAAGAGGVGSSGDINFRGNAGQPGDGVSGASGGTGGGSFFGGGGAGSADASAGTSGQNYGGGGGGAKHGSGADGGAGNQGVVMVREYR